MPEIPAPTDHTRRKSLLPVGILSRGGSRPAGTKLRVGYQKGKARRAPQMPKPPSLFSDEIYRRRRWSATGWRRCQ